MSTFDLISSLAYLLSAFLFAATATWALLKPTGGLRHKSLAAASLVTLLWSASVVSQGEASILSQVCESFRNLAWLGFMLLLVRERRETWHPAIVTLYLVVGTVIVAGILLELAMPGFSGSPRLTEAGSIVSIVLRMMVAIGALVLVHNLYTAASREARWSIRPPMAALAGMWVFDLNLYTVAYLTDGPVNQLYAARGLVMMLAAGVIAIGSRRNLESRVRVSRAITFQSLSLMAIGGYLVVMVLVVRALDLAGIPNIQLAQLTVLVGMTALGLALFPSRRMRAWLKVKLLKHFFQHRYDYRVEWMRFTETLGRPDKDAAPLDERVVKAIADITESPGGLLLLPDEAGGLMPGARWGWSTLDVPQLAADAAFAQHCEQGRIVELDGVRQGVGSSVEELKLVPVWMTTSPSVWAAVPLVHFGKLTGVVVLERPLVDRMLDWEDFDLLRLAGRQVASYLAEARGQEELLDAKRFDEFNRRFAFIMHDIKNLVSQLTLVARNAERHADNPRFRADMIATLKGSVDKMNDLLARLSQHNRGKMDSAHVVSLRAVADSVAANKRGGHPIQVEGSPDVFALADPLRLEQAVAHLVQNAIDASDPGAPVILAVEKKSDGGAILAVSDRGRGMSAEFIRNRLFRPFASTKEGGFGIGAYEARSLINAMDGRLDVTSREGEGSQFTIILPAATGEIHAEGLQRIAS